MEGSTSVNIRTSEMAKASILSPTKTATWEIGKKIVFQGMVCMSMPLARDSKGSFWMEKSTGGEFTTILAELSLMENGTKIENMGSASTPILMEKNTKGIG